MAVDLIDRRTLLLAMATWTGTPARAATPGPGPQILPLWPDVPPGGGGPSGPEHIGPGGGLSHIARPTLEVHVPAHPCGTAVLVAAGGGYKRIQMEKEARPAARWLVERGITAFLLTYRLPGEGWRDGPLAPLQDAQRALRLIRAQAAPFALDPNRIGVLGFSAGGHLLGLAATRAAFRSYGPIDATDSLSARPDAMALIYPIITLEPPYDHTSTRRCLIGDAPTAAQSAEWSVETHVRRGCPPVFLVQARDDRISNPQNTVLMEEACRRAGVPVELHRPVTGGHGFGMGRPGTASLDWPQWYESWLRARGLLS